MFLKIHKIHRKTLVPDPLFNKAADLRPATLLKKRLWHRCFLVNFVKFQRMPFFKTLFKKFFKNTFHYGGSYVQPKKINFGPKSFNLVPKKLNLVPKKFNLVPKNFNLVPKNFHLEPKSFNLVPKTLHLVQKIFSLVPKTSI